MSRTSNIAGKLFEIILILILGGRQPQVDENPETDLTQYIDYDVPVYVEINPGELLAASKSVPELKTVFALTADRDAAAAWISERIGSEPASIKEAFTGIRRIGFWLLGFGENGHNFRFLLVVDRGDGRDIIPALLEGNKKIKKPDPARRSSRREGYSVESYNDVKIHGFRNRRGLNLWLTEYKGKLALASDRFAAESFILQSKSAQPNAAQPKGRKPGSIIWGEVNGHVALNEILTTLGRHDYEEMAMVSSFFDFSAWQRGTISLTADHFEIEARISPAGRLTRVLKAPAKPPALLSTLPEKPGLAFIIALEDPNRLLKHITSGFAGIMKMEGRPERQNRLEEEFRRETGVDLAKDIAANITSAGVVIPVLKTKRDFERRFTIVGEVKDPAKIEATIGNFLARTFRVKNLTPMVMDGIKIWAVDDFKIVLAGKTVILGPANDGVTGVDAILEAHAAKAHKMATILPKRFPGAASFAVFNPSFLLNGRDIGLLTAGLSFAENTLKLRIDYSIAKFAQAFTDTIEAAILRGKKAQSVKNLKRIVKAAHAYLSDYGKYPDSFDKMLRYAGNDKKLFVSPVSGKPYVFNKKVAGVQAGMISDRSATVFAYDSPVGLQHGGGHVLFLNGGVQWLSTPEFKKTVGVQ